MASSLWCWSSLRASQGFLLHPFVSSNLYNPWVAQTICLEWSRSEAFRRRLHLLNYTLHTTYLESVLSMNCTVLNPLTFCFVLHLKKVFIIIHYSPAAAMFTIFETRRKITSSWKTLQLLNRSLHQVLSQVIRSYSRKYFDFSIWCCGQE